MMRNCVVPFISLALLACVLFPSSWCEEASIRISGFIFQGELVSLESVAAFAEAVNRAHTVEAFESRDDAEEEEELSLAGLINDGPLEYDDEDPKMRIEDAVTMDMQVRMGMAGGPDDNVPGLTYLQQCLDDLRGAVDPQEFEDLEAYALDLKDERMASLETFIRQSGFQAMKARHEHEKSELQ